MFAQAWPQLAGVWLHLPEHSSVACSFRELLYSGELLWPAVRAWRSKQPAAPCASMPCSLAVGAHDLEPPLGGPQPLPGGGYLEERHMGSSCNCLHALPVLHMHHPQALLQAAYAVPPVDCDTSAR